MAGAKKKGWLSLAARAADAPTRVWGRWLARRASRAGRFRSAQMRLTASQHHDDFRQMTFTFAVIALAAHIAKAGRSDTHEVFIAFREAFPMPASEHEKIHQLFTLALRDEAEAVHHARRIATLFPVSGHRRLLRDVLSRLVRLAMLEGSINDAQTAVLYETAQEFGLSRREMQRLLKAPHGDAPPANPYAVLGVRPQASEADIRRNYYRLMREKHPDQIQAQGGSSDAVMIASRQVAELTAAYQAIRTERRG